MELRVLRYFLAVAREENITAAAETLHISQPTLSKQLMDLEDELGKKLFVRGNRKISLTEEGMFLRKRAQEIVDLTDKTQAAFYSDEETISGEVFIGAGETEGFRYVTKALGHLTQTYPHVSFHLFSGNGEDVAERLDKGLIDFGLFVGVTDLKKYDYLNLPISDVWGLLLRRDHPLAAHESITPADLTGLPLLCSRQALIQNELAGWLGGGFEDLHVVGTYNLIYNASIMVSEGLGCALTIDELIDDHNEDLCFRPFEPPLTANLVVAWKKYQVFSKPAKKFLEILQKDLR